MNLTLPTDSNDRKEIPITSGVLRYFPAALAGVARISKAGNDKHNPGEPLHHARGKSMDHADCIMRHLMDVQDLLAAYERADHCKLTGALLAEASQLCWRALALSQELHERFGAPLAPGARLPTADQRPEWQARPESVIASCAPLSTPGFPVTLGRYRSRDGREFLVDRIVPGDKFPAKCFGPPRSSWKLDGSYSSGISSPYGFDLVERLPDESGAPHRSDPVDYP